MRALRQGCGQLADAGNRFGGSAQLDQGGPHDDAVGDGGYLGGLLGRRDAEPHRQGQSGRRAYACHKHL